MPAPGDLPAELAQLSFLNAIEIRDDGSARAPSAATITRTREGTDALGRAAVY